MNRQMLSAVLCATAALCSISSARAKVLVYEGFHPEDYNNVAAGGNVTASDCTLTGNHTTGVAYGSTAANKWNGMGGTQIKVYGENYGLALPSVMTGAGFTAHGGSIGTNPGGNDSQLRAMRHALASEVLKVSEGKLYVRMLLNIDSKAAGKLSSNDALSDTSGGYYGFGLCTVPGSNNHNLLIKTKAALAFAIWKNNSGQCNISFTHTTAEGTTATSYPILTDITLGSTYICYAEINVGAGEDEKEIIRAGAVKADDFAGTIAWAKLNGENESIETELITDSSYPNTMAVAGPYGSNGGYFRADELVVGTELGDILPAGGVFAVSATGTPTIGQTSFSTDWILVADAGVTADAGIVYSTDETFTIATTNSLGTGLSADTRTASLTGLEPDTTYWWKIYADNGTEVAETTPASFTTIGAPILGTATATMSGDSATYSVTLAEAALENKLPTSVSVFYGIDGENWTELPLGSASAAETFSGSVNNLGYGVTYQWFARASATMEGGRVLSTDSVTNSFTTLYNGDMYVDAATENATPPYSSTATAAANIPEALAIATDGATIHVAEGMYKISNPLSVTSAVRILGDDPDPSRTIVSNTVSAGDKKTNHRVFALGNADALVANMTMQNGQTWGEGTRGCSFYISTSGGMVSNCVVEAGKTQGNYAAAAGAFLEAGCVSHTIFQRCSIGSNTTSGQYNDRPNLPAVLLLKGSAKAENCLLTNNGQAKEKSLVLVRIDDNSVMRNCTIVDSGLGSTNTYCKEWSAIRIGPNATAQNVVIAGVTNKVDGAGCPPTGTRANFLNGATDADIAGLGFPEGTVTGTAESFFKDYANGDYTPKAGGPLVGKGANYEGMAGVDLAGNKRLNGSTIDIGCYEATSTALVIILR